AKKEHPVFEEPLIRRKPVRQVQQPPGQKTLHLKPGAPRVTKVEEKVDEEVIAEDKRKIPKEILFSRFLSGIVDLVLPLLIGLVFTIVASFLLGFDLLSPASMKWIGLLALSFFFFNSLFFFLTSGQTPGMLVTDLRLVGEHEEEDITTSSILLRVLFFLPSALTVVGLAWAIFDPLCRCFHDLVSRTRIEPAS
ncbi:MAG: RDD family protein, partial [bacterium]